MKYSISFASACILTACSILSSCRSTTGPSTTDPSQSTAGMTATINGTPWSGQTGGYRHAGPLQNLQFEGWTGSTLTDFHQLVIGVGPSINSPGTYTVDRSTVAISWVEPGKTHSDSYDKNPSGTLTISTLTATNVQGSFQVVLEDDTGRTVTITNGKFNAPLQ